jgi:hypothetical protein
VENGVNIHKTCINEYNSSQARTRQPKSHDLNLQLANQQIRDLRNK